MCQRCPHYDECKEHFGVDWERWDDDCEVKGTAKARPEWIKYGKTEI